MQETKHQILSTVALSKELIDEALLRDIFIDQISFIKTTEIESEDLVKRIETYSQKKVVTVFTSMNAVNAVTKHITQKQGWRIYCIGNATKKLIGKTFGKEAIAGTADSAEQLAELIISDKIKQVVFFCGDKRRDELPVKLKAHDIFVEEVVVYITTEIPVLLKKKYDGILFFSPSAVDSFFSINEVDTTTQLFAIGATTAKAIQRYNKNNVVISNLPGKENLVTEMITYFKKIKRDQTVL
jgi:uroporphyrinogen-III synthase